MTKPMADLNWQLPVALLCVAWAAFVLLRGGVKLLRGRSAGSCGTSGCGSCSSKDAASAKNDAAAAERPFVSLDSLGNVADGRSTGAEERHKRGPN
jgi:hypothetical protein